MTFVCPKCGYRNDQPDCVKGISHHCPKDRMKVVVMVKERT